MAQQGVRMQTGVWPARCADFPVAPARCWHFFIFLGELDDDEQRRREEFENQAEAGEGRGKWSGEGDHAAKGEA